mmetsp:Transcript_109947/g.306396  ORF Transcript_109947/g.306396 Transcript_109947/m.306396 type:complete len:208 (+) Transcript_109947:1522-2145(+)
MRSRAITSTGTRSRASSATSARRRACSACEASKWTARRGRPSAAGTGLRKGEPRQVFRKGGTSKNSAWYVDLRKARSAWLPIEPLRPMSRWYRRKTLGRDITKRRSLKRISRLRPSWKFRHSKARDQVLGLARPDWRAQCLPISFTYTKSSPSLICIARSHSMDTSRTTRGIAGCEACLVGRNFDGAAPSAKALATEVATSLKSVLV